jgi:hypothetical protein
LKLRIFHHSIGEEIEKKGAREIKKKGYYNPKIESRIN